MAVPTAYGALASFDIAIMAATISILIGGILFGVGVGFGARRLRLLGAEELGQGIISAAMLGALISVSAVLDTATSSMVPSELPSCPSVPSPASSPFSFYSCNLANLESAYSSLSASLLRSSEITGFASSLKISAGAVSAQPFFALEEVSRQFSSLSYLSQTASSAAYFERYLADFIRSSALIVFLPAGLVLRCFFATRRLGAAVMAIAISAYVVLPLLSLYSFQQSHSSQLAQEALASSSGFNSDFASIPLLDLDATSLVRDKMNEMAGADFSSRLQPVLAQSSRAAWVAIPDLLIMPLLSLAVSLVFAIELYRMLSARIFLPYFEAL